MGGAQFERVYDGINLTASMLEPPITSYKAEPVRGISPMEGVLERSFNGNQAMTYDVSEERCF